MPRQLDTAPLDAPVSSDDIRRAVGRWRAAGVLPTPFRGPCGVVAAIVTAVVVAVLVAVAAVSVGAALTLPSDRVAARIASTVWAVALVALIPVAFLAVRRATRRTVERWVRVERFARANGLAFATRERDPERAGLIFGVGRSRIADAVVRDDRRGIEIGDLTYTIGGGMGARTYRWGYLQLRLDRAHADLVLDARANDRSLGSNLPVAYAREQTVPLGDGFDRFFVLYSAEDGAAEARRILSPDVLRRLVDGTAVVDLEIVGDRLYLYGSGGGFSSADPAVWRWLFATAELLSARIHEVDAHPSTDSAHIPEGSPAAPPAGLAASGAALRRRVPTWAVVTLGVIGGLLLASLVAQIVVAVAFPELLR